MIRAGSLLVILLSGARLAAAADIDGPLVGPEDNYEVPVEQSSGGVAGYIEGSYGAAVDAPGDIDTDSWELRGAVNFDAGSGMNLQVDLGYTRASYDDLDTNSYDGALHGYYRDNTYAAGAFLQAARLDPGIDTHVNDYLGGLEGAYFLDTWTLHGALGYGQTRMEGIDADHYMGALGARIYATDNIRFDIDGSLNRISESDIDYDLRTLKLTANYRPEAFPVTLFAGYKYVNEELSGFRESLSGNTSTIFGGLRFSFGSATLREEERLGPVWSNNRLAF
ncbi:opacity protein-like surface antigen [Ensifer sp. WSM1721]|uniref:hypothetical protein n=1 Tax=Ensifer sp. WSM1721 TaxID=1041159 RepID=UPI00047AE698|nr:hypothetical protein [Ensifer sp. WSM1721]